MTCYGWRNEKQKNNSVGLTCCVNISGLLSSSNQSKHIFKKNMNTTGHMHNVLTFKDIWFVRPVNCKVGHFFVYLVTFIALIAYVSCLGKVITTSIYIYNCINLLQWSINGNLLTSLLGCSRYTTVDYLSNIIFFNTYIFQKLYFSIFICFKSLQDFLVFISPHFAR